MKAFANFAKRFVRDSRGATAIEYALIASLVSMSIVVSTGTIGGQVRGLFEMVNISFAG